MRLFILLFICLFICESSFSARDYKVFFYRVQTARTPGKTFYMALLAFVTPPEKQNESVEKGDNTTYRLVKLTDASQEAEKIENHSYYELLSLAKLFGDYRQKKTIIYQLKGKSFKSSMEKAEVIKACFRGKSLTKEIEVSFNVDDSNCSRLYQTCGEFIFEVDFSKYGSETRMIKMRTEGLLKPINRYLKIPEDEYKQSYCQILGNEIYKPSPKLNDLVVKNIKNKKEMRRIQETQNESPDLLKFSPVADADEIEEAFRLFENKAKNALGLNVAVSERK